MQNDYLIKMGVLRDTYTRLVDYNYIRFLDAYLHSVVFDSICSVINTYEHFGVYNTLISQSKIVNKDVFLHGHQHGIIEKPWKPYSYNPVKFDKYYLIYKQSMNMVVRNYAHINDLNIVSIDHQIPSNFSSLTTKNKPIIAFAMAEGHDNDIAVVSELIWLTNIFQFKLIIYPHPSVRLNGKIKTLISGLDCYRSQRHSNIDLLVTRYSSLSVDYIALKVPVLFVPLGQNICLFDSEDSFDICHKINMISSHVQKYLNP